MNHRWYVGVCRRYVGACVQLQCVGACLQLQFLPFTYRYLILGSAASRPGLLPCPYIAYLPPHRVRVRASGPQPACSLTCTCCLCACRLCLPVVVASCAVHRARWGGEFCVDCAGRARAHEPTIVPGITTAPREVPALLAARRRPSIGRKPYPR